jgi:hypothetical protein
MHISRYDSEPILPTFRHKTSVHQQSLSSLYLSKFLPKLAAPSWSMRQKYHCNRDWQCQSGEIPLGQKIVTI